LVGAMPIAASSTAWTQKGNGNLALSLGLILVSTLFSPLTTPMALHFSGDLTTGDYSEDLHLLANGNANLFLILSVVVPSLTGILVHFILKEQKANRLRNGLKEINLLILLMLNYFNASNVLPGIIKNPDWDFLLMIVIVTSFLCVSAFGVGALISKTLKVDKAERTSLMFGLGMNNNGTGLVLASMSLSDHPLVMLPIIIYNLLQHIIAGLVDKNNV
jgi:bile acid:Na+ symporter, BASS family